jgi:hypothetical protein
VRAATDRPSLLHETGSKPYQLYWLRSIVGFYNKIRDGERLGASALLLDAFHSDLHLAADGCGSCWAAELITALQALDPAWAELARQGLPLPEGPIEEATRQAIMVRPWAREELAGRTKRRTYAAHCQPNPELPQIPIYMDFASLSRHRVRQVARFRLVSHNLRMERGRWERPPEPANERVCTRCSEGWCEGRGGQWVGALGVDSRPLDSEDHLLFDCETTWQLRAGQNWEAGQNESVARLLAVLDPDTARYVADCMDLADNDVLED